MEYRANTLREAVAKAVRQDQNFSFQKDLALSKKYKRFSVWAGPLLWGPWTEIWAQYGVIGQNRDKHRTDLQIHFDVKGEYESSFDVEIRFAGQVVRTIGPGSHIITIDGNIATGVSVRFRSHSVPLEIVVTV